MRRVATTAKRLACAPQKSRSAIGLNNNFPVEQEALRIDSVDAAWI